MPTSIAAPTPNPFEVTKATDLDDDQIEATWVDLPSGGGFRSLIDPRSPVTRFVLGGKGSGRTHVMRYYSSSLQAIRIREHGADTLFGDKYVGVYVNSSTLNPGRFLGKGQDDDTWKAVFSYYLDLWLSLRTLMAVDELWLACGNGAPISDIIAEEILLRFRNDSTPSAALVDILRLTLRDLDSAINEAAVTRELGLTLRTSADHVVFSTAEALTATAPFRGFQFAVLLDEFENFSELQQRCVNTLVREKPPSVSFIVGARTYGVRTHATTAGEQNIEGSEFQTIRLDSLYRDERLAYDRFCRNLVTRRLMRTGLFASGDEIQIMGILDAYFVDFSRPTAGASETAFVEGRGIEARKCLVKLSEQLREHRPFSVGDQGIERIIGLLHFPDDPVIEKVSVLLFYRAWHNDREPVAAAAAIHADAEAFASGKKGIFATTMGHFRQDMLAQLLDEYRQKQRYLGFSECVALSGGLPRALLVVLKHIYRWAVFNGERPFASGCAISEETQRAGVREAAHWFRTDLPSIGPNGARARSAVERLGRFLNALRFSDKPTESSACTISLDRDGLTAPARSIVDHCIECSFLLPILRGHSDRNTGERLQKLQVHPMLCPLWDLPTGRRGVVELSTAEAAVIFEERVSERFREMTRRRLSRMNAPFRVSPRTLKFDD